MTAIAAPDYDFLVTLLRDRSAIVLEPGKEYLASLRHRIHPYQGRCNYSKMNNDAAQLAKDEEATAAVLTDIGLVK